MWCDVMMEENILKDKLRKITMEHYCYFTLIIVLLVVICLFMVGYVDSYLYNISIEQLSIIISFFGALFIFVCIFYFVESYSDVDYDKYFDIKPYRILCCCIIICLVCLCGVLHCFGVLQTRADDLWEQSRINENIILSEDAVVVDNEVVVNNNGVTVKQYTHVTISYG